MKGRGRAVLQVGNSYLLRPNLNLDIQPGETESGETELGETEPIAIADPGAVQNPGSETKPKIYPESRNVKTEVLMRGEKSPVSAYNLEASVQIKNSSFILNSCQR